MPSRRDRTASWVRGLFRGEENGTELASGVAGCATGLRALRLLEQQAADRICTLAQDGARADDDAAVNCFDRCCPESLEQDAGALVAAARGQALAGLRVAGFLSAGALLSAREQLGAAVRQRLPLLLHATTEDPTGAERGGHRDYHALAGTGAFLLMGRSAQHALDLALAARLAAERSLTPGILAVDGAETGWAIQSLRSPGADLIHELLADPDDRIEAPTPAQSLLFDRERRRIPRWFDPDRPTAHSLPLVGRDVDAAAASRRAFFTDHLPALAAEAMRAVAERTGRPLDVVTRFRTGGARQIIVAQGAAIDTAEAAAKVLRKHDRLDVGVLGIVWLRPFPAKAVREALRDVERIVVLERVDEGTPLSAEIGAALRGTPPRLRTATFESLTAAGVVELCRDSRQGDAERTVRLGSVAPRLDSDFPKREAWLQRVRRDYPQLEREVLAVDETLDTRPPGSTTVVLQLRNDVPPEKHLESLSAAMVDSVGPHVRSSVTRPRPGLWQARVTSASEPLLEPDSGVDASLALVAGIEAIADSNAAAAVAHSGLLIVSTDLEPGPLWTELPGSWRDEIRRRRLRLFTVAGGPTELIALGSRWIQANPPEAETAGATVVDWTALPDPRDEPDERPPIEVRRFTASAGGAYDSASRFWSEFVQPRLERGGGATEVDPYLALGIAPPCSASLGQGRKQAGVLPSIDPGSCTGCGVCWTACPDSAIAPVTASTESLLDAAADAAPAGPDQQEAEGKLKRLHRQLAGRVDGLLAKAGARSLTPDTLGEAFDWLLEKMKAGDDEAPPLRRRFDAMRPAMDLPLTATDPFFHEMHRIKKGSGELLLLSVDPRTCQGCGLCAASCPEEAIVIEKRSPQRVAELSRARGAWERLPDTPGPTIARAASNDAVGALPAVMMSRHSLFSLVGPDGAEPGSGERMALRQVLAVVEYEMQRRAVSRIEALDELNRRLREAIRAGVVQSVPTEDLERLEEALAPSGSAEPKLTAVLARLEELGERTDVDATSLRRLVAASREIEQLRHSLAEGELGVGRARFGLVITGGGVGEWAARFPENPFGAPSVVALDGEGPDLAVGLARGLAGRLVEEVRATRRAELLLEAPSDLPARFEELRRVEWKTLNPDESSLCPPVLVVLGAEGLEGRERAGIGRLLDARLPLMLVVLDEHDLHRRGLNPLTLTLAHRAAFAASTSIAHPDHLFESVSAALNAVRPALIHVHAPSPRRHGFEPARTLERARLAVESRVHPLVCYEPGAEGVFGSRLSLAGNPAVDRTWAGGVDDNMLTAADWALGETRFADAFVSDERSDGVPVAQWSTLSPGERGARTPTVPGPNGRALAVGGSLAAAVHRRLEHWTTLQELAGVVTPFTGAVREQVERELRDTQRAEIESLSSRHAAELAELRRSETAAQAGRLRERLLQMAGFRKPEADGPGREGSSS